MVEAGWVVVEEEQMHWCLVAEEGVVWTLVLASSQDVRFL